MDYLTTCPVCQSQNLKVLKKHTFVPTDVVLADELKQGVSDLEERLWIYFHKILKRKEPAVVESTLCQSCDLIFSNPRFTEADIAVKYQTIEALGFDQLRHKDKGLPKSEIRGQRVLKLVKEVLPADKNDKKLKVLDYGGAEGYLLEPFINEGHEGFLIDFVVYQKTHPKIQYLGRDLKDLSVDTKFDVILLLHTLEHVVDPVTLLRGLAQHLSPGGLLYVEVPLGAWLEWEFLREPVTHLNFFSETSLNQTVRSAGLHPLFVNSRWQWVTTTQTVCINFVATNADRGIAPTLKPLASQMRGVAYIMGGMRNNFKYYTKLMVKHYLNDL